MAASYIPLETVRGLDRGPLVPHVGAYIERARIEGYPPKTVLVHVQLVASLNRYLRRTRCTTRDIDERLIARFIRRDPRAHWSPGPSVTLARLLALLREVDAAPPASTPPDLRTPAQRCADEFRAYLRKDRGMSEASIYGYSFSVESFLKRMFGRGAVRFAKLTGCNVTDFLPWEIKRRRLHHTDTCFVTAQPLVARRCIVKSFDEAAGGYLVLRRSVGFRFERHEIYLREFIAFLGERRARWITTRLALQFATCHPDHGSKTQAARLSVARGFATYMLGVDPRTEVPPSGLLPARHVCAKPYIYITAEVKRVLTAARECDSVYHPLRPWNLYCILGLLAVTGMRISEVVNLRPEDIDWERRVLTVRKTKFGKTRIVPLHASTMKVLRAFAAKREREVVRRERKSRRKAFYFFFSKRGQRYDASYIWRVFCELSREVGLRRLGDRHGPRLHDFRHRFAVETLVRCYRKGGRVEHGLSLLSTYLGHTQVSHTYWYLSCSPRLMAAASAQLETRWREVS